MGRIKKSTLFKKTVLGPRTPFTLTPKADHILGYGKFSKKTYRKRRVSARDHGSEAYYIDPRHPRYREFRIGKQQGVHRGYWGGYIKVPKDGFPAMHVFHMHDLSTEVKHKGPGTIYQISLASHQGNLPKVRRGVYSKEGRRGYIYSDVTDPTELKHLLGLHRDALSVLYDEHGPTGGEKVLFEEQVPKPPKDASPKELMFYQVQKALVRSGDWEKMVDSRGRPQLPGVTVEERKKRPNTPATHIRDSLTKIIETAKKNRFVLEPIEDSEPKKAISAEQKFIFDQSPTTKSKKKKRVRKKKTGPSRKAKKTKGTQIQKEFKFK